MLLLTYSLYCIDSVLLWVWTYGLVLLMDLLIVWTVRAPLLRFSNSYLILITLSICSSPDSVGYL